MRLLSNASLLENIIDKIDAVIYVKDVHGRHLLVNRSFEQVVKISRSTILGKLNHELFPKDQADRLRSNDLEVLRTGKEATYEEEVSVHGMLRTYQSVKFPLRDAVGETCGLCGISTDVTELKTAEEDRRRAQAALEEARQRFTQEFISAQERERRKMASDLHDSVGHSLILIRNHALLALLATDASQAEEEKREHLKSILDLSAAAIEDVRSIAENLHPYQLDRLGLTEALRSLMRRTAGSCPFRISAKIEEINNLCSREAELNIYRLVQEAVSNVVKHSRATAAFVTVERDIRHIRIAVWDNGQGIDAAKGAQGLNPCGGLGFQSMRQRVQMLGASMDVCSDDGRGTVLRFDVPLVDGISDADES